MKENFIQIKLRGGAQYFLREFYLHRSQTIIISGTALS